MAPRAVGWWSRLFQATPFEESEDPDAAPAAGQGPCPARPWTWRRGEQNLLRMYLLGLVFLVFAVADLAERELADRLLGGVLLVLIAGGYVLAAWVADAGLRVRQLYLLGYLALLVSGAAVWRWEFTNFGVYLAIMITTLLPWRQARVVLLAWGGFLLAVALLTWTWAPVYIATLALGVGLALGAGLESGRISARLRRTEQRVSVLAVAAERERIGRDLHDILGHSLTAISIMSGLAGRLVDRDPEAAKAQLAEIEEVARQALADVRSTASGYRGVRVAAELASARSVLGAAGIQARVPAALPALADGVSELFGYVVREAVTNVVRHSGARTCTVAVTPDEVQVSDDGTGLAGRHPGDHGSGLRGLALRLEAAGGRLEISPGPDGGTTVRALLDPAAAALRSPAGPGRERSAASS